MDIGGLFSAEKGCSFTVWAPLVEEVTVEIFTGGEQSQSTKQLSMEKDEEGYWKASASELSAGTRYKYCLDGEGPWPDPASRFQPEGVHGPSEVVDHSAFEWSDHDWQGIDLRDYIIYELHVSTFTPEGTFEAAITRLPDLVQLGITAIEIMPVSQFPGERNWGYDLAFPFAVQNSYGGPDGLKKLVNACHQQGLAVVLDVIYNHLGPEGNYTNKFGPYNTYKYQTPWGAAINFDDAYCYGVRRYYTDNAISWLRDYHIDALRLDAVHAIYDFGAKHFLQHLSECVADFAQERGRPAHLIAESDLNDPKLIRPAEEGGYQLCAQWSDDFHHALHARLTGETNGYYSDYASLESLAVALKNRFVYSGQYSRFRQREHGGPAHDLPSHQFVVCNQNHDQIGNRIMGDRLSTLISFSALKLAAGITLLSPYIPLLFMGEEYAETNPFLYFVDHNDPELLKAVKEGRRKEFADFHKSGELPEPDSKKTHDRSVLNWLSIREKQPVERQKQVVMRRFYQRLIEARKQCKVMTPTVPPDITIAHNADTLQYRQSLASGDLLCLMNFSKEPAKVGLNLGAQVWWQQVNSADPQWFVEEAEDRANIEPLPSLISEAESEPTLVLSPQSIVMYRAEPTSAWSLSHTSR